MSNEKKILVVGDSCRDVFVYCETSRLAPDVPVPVLQVVHQTENPGMAKNLERNIKALHQQCDVVTNENWQNVTKVRYMHDKTNHCFMRVDAERVTPLADVRTLLLRAYDIVAISDYDKGFMTRDDIRYICENHPCVFVDTKKPVANFLDKCAYIKINQQEFEASSPISPLLQKKIICTKGGEGAEFRGVAYPTDRIEVKDVSGAGDSFFAGLIAHYVKTADIEGAIRFANKCATQVVQHKGVSVIQNVAMLAA